jgi:hypothetical protein
MANPVNRMLWYALVTSQILYVLVAEVVKMPARDADLVALLVPVFAGLSLAVGAGTIVYRKRALVVPIQAGRLDPSNPEHVQRAFTPFILNLTLTESIGIYGLLLALLSGETGYCLAFGGAAIVLFFVHRPTAPDLVPPMSGMGTPPPIG